MLGNSRFISYDTIGKLKLSETGKFEVFDIDNKKLDMSTNFIGKSYFDFDVIQVVPPSSPLLMIENESQAGDCCEDQNVEGDWCKALLCRRCGAVALLEREPKGFHHEEPLTYFYCLTSR